MKSEILKKTLDIGEVTQLSGIPASAIRFYEEKGLIRSTGRHGLKRLFSSHVLQQLEFITLGQSAGLALDDIAAMFTTEGRLKVNREFLIKKAGEIQKSLRRLEAVRETLLHVAKCSAPNHMECPKFQRLLQVSGRTNRIGRRRSRSKK